MRLGRLGFGIALAAILAGATLVRLPLVPLVADSYRTTEAFNIDEAENIRLSSGMLHKHSLNPHAFEYPSLFYNLSLAVEFVLQRTGNSTWRDFLIGVRCLSLAFGLGIVALAALLARRLGGRAAGLLAGLLVAFDRTLIEASALAKPNTAQVFFLLAAWLALVSLAWRPRLKPALLASVSLALATASKWLGVLGLAGLALAPLLSAADAAPAGSPRGPGRLLRALRAGASTPAAPWKLFLPLALFGAVFLACVPYALLSLREFGFGFGQVFMAQSLHQREVARWMPLVFLARSLGPLGALLCAGAFAWAAWRIARWDGSAHDRGLALVLGWAAGYGALLLFVFVRLPAYLDLWVPFLAVLAGCAWAGHEGLLRSDRLRAAAVAFVLISGIVANGAFAAARSHVTRSFDTRLAAAGLLARTVADSDTVLADLGALVPDRFAHVYMNGWGTPPRVIYDETRTWGWDPVWPEWTGGHRRLVFENAKWIPADTLLARRPRWVVTAGDWRERRLQPRMASESASPDYDASLADGRAGYTLRARFEPAPLPGNAWQQLGLPRRTGDGGPYYSGPLLLIYERTDGNARH